MSPFSQGSTWGLSSSTRWSQVFGELITPIRLNPTDLEAGAELIPPLLENSGSSTAKCRIPHFMAGPAHQHGTLATKEAESPKPQEERKRASNRKKIPVPSLQTTTAASMVFPLTGLSPSVYI